MSMFDFENDLNNILSREDDVNDVEYIETVGSNPDGGADVEDATNIANAPDADEVFNDDHANDVPASVEELEEEISEGDNYEAEMVEDLSSDVPGEIDDADVSVDEEAGEVETTDVNVDSEPLSEATDEEETPEVYNAITDENPTGEMGIDMDHAIECIFRSTEEEIQVIVGDTEVSIDEAGKVSVDQNGDGDSSAGDNDSDSDTDFDNSESDNDSGEESNDNDASEGGEESDNSADGENTAESMFLDLDTIFNNSNFF